MLKRYAITLVLALFAMGAYSFAQQDQNQPAQNPNSSGQHEHNGGGRNGWGPRDPAQMVQHMTQELNLTSDQQSKVLAILQDQQKQMQALRDDTTTPQEDKRAKFMDLHKNTMSQVRAVLTDDQQKKFDEMQQKREQEMGQHRKNSEGNDQPKSDEQPKSDQK